MQVRHVVVGVVAIAACAALWPVLTPAIAVAPAAEGVVVPVSVTDRRTISVRAFGIARYPADTFTVRIEVWSGQSLPEQAQPKIDAVMDRARALLREASLPAAEPTPDSPATTKPSVTAGEVIAEHFYTVKADSYETARRVQQVLAPLIDGSNRIADRAYIASADPHAYSSKLRADPEAGRAEARRLVLVNARDEAAQSAAVLGMTLGPPVTIGKLTVSAQDSHVLASGDVVFELHEE